MLGTLNKASERIFLTNHFTWAIYIKYQSIDTHQYIIDRKLGLIIN